MLLGLAEELQHSRQRDLPHDLLAKCVEVYHWRHAAVRDADGEPRIDEDIVARLPAETLADPRQSADILQRMQRYRDGRGIYGEGGCIDSTREQIKWVGEGEGAGDLVLPAA